MSQKTRCRESSHAHDSDTGLDLDRGTGIHPATAVSHFSFHQAEW